MQAYASISRFVGIDVLCFAFVTGIIAKLCSELSGVLAHNPLVDCLSYHQSRLWADTKVHSNRYVERLYQLSLLRKRHGLNPSLPSLFTSRIFQNM